MTDLIREFVQAPAPLSMLIVILGTVFASLKVFLDYRRTLVNARRGAEAKLQAEVTSESVDNLSQLLTQNFRVLNTYYSENLSQARTSTMASVAISVLGFIIIVAGILIAFIGKEAMLGSVSSTAGIVAEGAAALFFRQNRVFLGQMESSLRKLVSMQYLMTSIALARDLPDGHRIVEGLESTPTSGN